MIHAFDIFGGRAGSRRCAALSGATVARGFAGQPFLKRVSNWPPAETDNLMVLRSPGRDVRLDHPILLDRMF
jgi:hypothetical protein